MFHLNIPRRITLCVLVFALPLAMLLYYFIRTANNDIEFAQQEIRGSAYLIPLVDAFENVSQHELQAIRFAMGDPKMQEDMNEHGKLASEAFDRLVKVQDTLGVALQFTPEGLGARKRENLKLADVKAKWEAILANAGKVNPEQAAPAYAELKDNIRGMIGHAGDTSNLILDPDLDSYYLMDDVLLGIPQMLADLSNIGAYMGKRPPAGTPLSDEDLTKLSVLRYAVQQDLDRVNASMQTALNEDANFYGKNPTLERNITPALAEFNNVAKVVLGQSEEALRNRFVHPAQLLESIEKVQDASMKLWGISNDELRELLITRIDSKASDRNFTLSIVGIALLLACGLFFLTARSITRPLKTLQSVMLELAEGNLDRVIPFAGRKDEIGEMAGTLEQFKQTGLQARSLQEQQNIENIQRTERQKRIEQMIHQFEGKISGTLSQVSQSAVSMYQSAESMVGDMEKTSAATKDTAVATMETSNTVSAVAAGAEELSAAINEISRQVAKAATITSEAVQKTTAADVIVQKLSSSAQKIGEIINLINNIAEQINLLALNATIESARAGDAGKGFAVVASEVKNLANQTSKATDAITLQISDMQNVVGGVITELNGIRGAVEEINGVSTTIASAVEEQGAATQEIAKNIQMTSERVQRVAANIGDVETMSEQTNGNAKSVLDNVRNFTSQSQAINNDIESFLGDIARA